MCLSPRYTPYVQTSTYIFKKYTQRQKIPGKYKEKKPIQVGLLPTYTVSYTIHRWEPGVTNRYPQQNPPKSTYKIIAVVITFNYSLATPTNPQCTAERIFPSESWSLVHVRTLYNSVHCVLVLFQCLLSDIFDADASSVCLSELNDLTTAE